MPSLTTHYSFNLPAVNSAIDEDSWGDQLNGNWTSIDALLYTNTTNIATNTANIATNTTNIATNTADIANVNSVPTAAILSYASIDGATIPTGYLRCEGALVSRETYADLFAVIGTTFGAGDGTTTFTLPDFRGAFLRGWDNGKGQDPSRVFGSYQADENKSHSHTLTLNLRTGGIHGGKQGPHFSSEHINHGSGTATTANSGGDETRPKNFAILYIIKY